MLTTHFIVCQTLVQYCINFHTQCITVNIFKFIFIFGRIIQNMFKKYLSLMHFLKRLTIIIQTLTNVIL